MKRQNDSQRGDTLVEVLIAITVLGIIVVGAMAIMNRSLVSIINSTERTAVRADVNSQTEMLNYVRAKNADMWGQIKSLAFSSDKVASANTQCKLNPNSNSSTSTAGSFYLSADSNASSVSLKTGLVDNTTAGAQKNGKNLAGRAVPGTGIWIDAVYYPVVTGSNNVPYFDFYIKACWTPLGNNPDSQTITIVRIYDNNNQ